MFEDFSFPDPTPWLQRVWQDLQPTPGRLSMALRMTLASILVLVLMLVLQMPYIAYGLYFVFLIGRESPSVSLRTSVALVASIALIIPAEMGVVIVSDNDPMARVLSVAIGAITCLMRGTVGEVKAARADSFCTASLDRGCHYGNCFGTPS
jgi:multidrug resistance protein MdtO